MEIRIETNPGAFDDLQEAVRKAFTITLEEYQGELLNILGVEHRRQEKRIFISEGAEGGRSSWPPLHPDYAAFKEEVLGHKPILVWSGDMRARFVSQMRPEYFQAAVPVGDAIEYQFGAFSEIAQKHAEGAWTTILPRTLRSKRTGKRVTWPKGVLNVQLPIRDMVSKTAAQVEWLMRTIDAWYQRVKVPRAVEQLEAARKKGNAAAGGPKP